MINSFAKIKCQLNTPARKRSVYAKWKPVTGCDLALYCNNDCDGPST